MTRNHILVCAVALLLASNATADLLITEVVDGTLPGGQPKWVELTATAGTFIGSYSLGNFNGGSLTLSGGASTMLNGPGMSPGSSMILAYEADPGGPGLSQFFAVYGKDPDFYLGGGFVNGDDVIALFLGQATGDGTDAVMVDVYGELGTDGTGTGWETTDSYGYRLGASSNGGVFDQSDWFFAGRDALEAGCAGDDICETTNLIAFTTPGLHLSDTNAMPGTGVCFGDGSGAACPCGNFGNAGEGCLNSSGTHGATTTGFGVASLSNDTFRLHIDGVHGTHPVLLLRGDNLFSAPLGGGLYCVGGNTLRSQVQITLGGTTTFYIFKTVPGGVVTIGEVSNLGIPTYYQAWYRDPLGAPCGTFNFTSAWSVTYVP